MNDLPSIAVSNAVAALVLALMAYLVGAVSRRPALVHGLWLLVLLKLVTPPLIHIPINLPHATETVPVVADEQPASVLTPSEEPTLVVLPRVADVEPTTVESILVAGPPTGAPPDATYWLRILSMVWLAGSSVWFVLALTRLVRFRRLLRFARPAPTPLQERCAHLSQSLGVKRCPQVCLLPGRIAPMVWGIGTSPRLFVPADLLAVLSEEQVDTLLAHELAHLRRRDHWVRALEFVVMGLYWWHPVVWYARRELREAEEQCCDAWVVSTQQDAGRTYASALLDTLDFLSTTPAAVPPLASGLGQVVDLKRRLSMIMRGTTPRSLNWPGCLAVVALGMMCLPMLPVLHSQSPSTEEQKQIDEQEAEKMYQSARQNLAQQQERAMAAELQFKAAAAQMKAIELEKRLKHQKTLEKAMKKRRDEVNKEVIYRIEITDPNDGSVNMNEIGERILNVLPEKLHRSFFMRSFAATKPPAVEMPLPPTGKSSENRINDLEKKLEKMIHELHEMRKEMKEAPPILRP